MTWFTTMHDMWAVVSRSLLVQLPIFVSNTVSDIILLLFENPYSELTSAEKVIYDGIIDVLDLIVLNSDPVVTLSDVSLISLMLGSGFLFVIVYILFKFMMPTS